MNRSVGSFGEATPLVKLATFELDANCCWQMAEPAGCVGVFVHQFDREILAGMEKQKGTLNKQSAWKIPKLFLYAKDRVFGSFGNTEFHNPLGLDLDGLASGRIAAHTGFAIDQNELAQSRNGEGVFGILVSQLRDIFQYFDGLLFGDAVLFGDFRCDL